MLTWFASIAELPGMAVVELRDLDVAHLWVLQGFWLSCVRPPAAGMVPDVLRWALEIASAGQPLPPVGFVADVGHLVFGGAEVQRQGLPSRSLPGLPSGLLRSYEDYVLGKLYADPTFARAADALRRYAPGRNQSLGLAFLIEQFRIHAGLPGVLLSPGVIKAMLEMSADTVLAEGWQSLEREGILPLLVEQLQALIAAVRLTGDVLRPEDLFELEHGTALQPQGERLALRQVLQAAACLEAELPTGKPRTESHADKAPTHLLDEDAYPVGGFASLSNRGSLESLLQSQLAYMEDANRPDLFDVKYLRDELLYYSRDENEFLRRRRTFAIVLFPDLVATRFKDAHLRWQRGILLLALLVVTIRKLCQWLSTESQSFVIFFPAGKPEPLKPERELLATLLREQIANQTVEFASFSGPEDVEQVCAQRARRSRCHCLVASVGGQDLRPEGTMVSHLRIHGPVPELVPVGQEQSGDPSEGPLESWRATLQQLLSDWL
jgi:hypothetical protein